MRITIVTPIALSLSLLCALPGGAQGQGRISEKGVVAQSASGTTITVEYYRPVARGRTPFGDDGVVRWGQRWTPGANWATTIDVDHDVHVEGQLLPKGRYSMWTVPGRDSWTIAFHRRWHLFHMAFPDSSDEQLRLRVRPDSGPPVEVLTFDFPEISTGATTLRLRWGTVVVPLHLALLAPPLRLLGTRADRARYVGRYDLEIFPQLGIPGRKLLVDVADVSDTLRWRDASGPEAQRRDFVFIPAGPDDEFTRARRAPDGQYWPEGGITVSFTMANGRAEGFEVRIEDGTVVSRAKRIP